MKRVVFSILSIVVGIMLITGCGGDGDNNKNPLDSNGDGGTGDGTYTVSGRIVDSSGSGIPNITVGLTSENVQKTTSTDSSGNYSFTGITNGSYMVITAQQDYTFTPEFRPVTVSGSNVTVDNFTGSKANGGDGGNGPVTDTITITVGEGIVPQISWDGGNIDVLIVMDTKTTGSNYSWYITSKEGTVNNISSPVTYGVKPDSADEEANKPLQVNRQYRVTIVRLAENDSVIGYAYFSTEGYEYEGGGYIISGSVIDENRHGLPDAAVVLKSSDGSTVLATTITDSNGSYSFTNVENGTYIVDAVHVDYTFRNPNQTVTVENDDVSVSSFRGKKKD